MPTICYREKAFRSESLRLIEQANRIIAEYTAEGYQLTLRQLYYQFVARDLIDNTLQAYNRIGSIINDARLAGLIDWDAIEDRTRNVQFVSHWASPADIVQAAAKQFRTDKWSDQEYRVEVWIEKEALAGVIAPACQRLDIPYFSCRGYTSQSEMWSAGQRLLAHGNKDQIPIIIHLGDHDPSGIDMTRDIIDRLELFIGQDIEVSRIALNFDQIEKYKPPPNPAKTTDSRFRSYIQRFGPESWELDALDPKTLTSLIERTVLSYRDENKWAAQVQREQEYRKRLEEVAGEHDWNNGTGNGGNQ